MCFCRARFVIDFEWILGGFWEDLGMLGGCQAGTKAGPKANSSRNLIFGWFWKGSGADMRGLRESFGRVLEGFG